ncbi:alpha/beta hydrolase [Nanoarchaeota archaeon]
MGIKKILSTNIDKAINNSLDIIFKFKYMRKKITQSKIKYDIKKILKNPDKFMDFKKIKFSEKLIRKRKNYDEYKITFTSPLESKYPTNNIVHANYLKVKNSKGSVVMVHGWREFNFIFERWIAADLRKRGLSALIVQLPYHMDRRPIAKKIGFIQTKSVHGEFMLNPDTNQMLESFLQSVLDVKSCIEFLSRRGEKNIGLLGHSIGGIFSLLTFFTDKRIKACVPWIASGYLYDMFYDSDILKPMKSFAKKFYDQKELKKKMEDVDPINYIKKTDKVLMINGNWDTIVPKKYVEKTFKKLGNKSRLVWVDMGHSSLFMERKQLTNMTSEFILEKFGK